MRNDSLRMIGFHGIQVQGLDGKGYRKVGKELFQRNQFWLICLVYRFFFCLQEDWRSQRESQSMRIDEKIFKRKMIFTILLFLMTILVINLGVKISEAIAWEMWDCCNKALRPLRLRPESLKTLDSVSSIRIFCILEGSLTMRQLMICLRFSMIMV